MIKKLSIYSIAFCFYLFTFQGFGQETFSNPILPKGADPFSFFHKGFYYYTHTTGNKIKIWKTKNLSNLANAESKIIFSPPKGLNYSEQLWAPEIHFIEGKWFAYFAADDGNNSNHRMYVLENNNPDPFEGTWEFKGKIAARPDRWAIDGNVFQYKNQLYMIWSGWEGFTNVQQNIYIAPMDSPTKISSRRVLIAEPTYNWEKQGDLNNSNNPHVNVNEGPQFLQHGEDLFIIFSANGCWTDYYSLGLLKFDGDDLLDPSAWTKYEKPIFKKSEQNSVFAPGHNSFFKSPNGKEDWILYHANNNPGEGCGGERSPRMQKLSWDEAGNPVLGIPVSTNAVIKIPSE